MIAEWQISESEPRVVIYVDASAKLKLVRNHAGEKQKIMTNII